ncbi:hypothetical protein LXL04_015081 [Taraxacum kok-saghyz]
MPSATTITKASTIFHCRHYERREVMIDGLARDYFISLRTKASDTLALFGANKSTELARTELDVKLGLISDCPDRVRHQRLLPNTSDSGPSPTSKAKF